MSKKLHREFLVAIWLMKQRDIQVLKTYGAAPYGAELKKLEKEIKDKQQTINEKIGVKVNKSEHRL